MTEPKRLHGSRFRDALVIINGACNPSGVALSIADACREMREHENADTKSICQDLAIRLMVYQLAHLIGVAGAQYDLVHYINDEAACKERLAGDSRRTKAVSVRKSGSQRTRCWRKRDSNLYGAFSVK
jgi:hypothetical protein